MTKVSIYKLVIPAVLMIGMRFFFHDNYTVTLVCGVLISLYLIHISIYFSKKSAANRAIWYNIAIYILLNEVGRVLEFITNNPEHILYALRTFTYALSKFFIIAAILMLYKLYHHNIDKKQLSVDILKITVITLYTLVGIFSKNFSVLETLPGQAVDGDLYFYFYFFADILLIWLVFAAVSCVRIKPLSLYILPICVFAISITMVDLLSVYRNMDLLKYSKMPQEMAHYIGLYALMIGGFFIYDNRKEVYKSVTSTNLALNIGKTYTTWWMLAYVLVTYSLHLIGLDLLIQIIILAIVLEILDNMVQSMVITQHALKIERIENEELSNITESMKREIGDLNEELMIESTIDPISGLYNRQYFIFKIDEKLKEGSDFALVLCDISRFDSINYLYGHSVGDEVLKELGFRMAPLENDGICCSRFGGDEFAFILENPSETRLKTFISQISDLMSTKLTIGGLDFVLDIAIGTALFPHDAKSTPDIIKHCHASLKYSKTSGNFILKSEAPMESLKRRNYIELELRNLNFNEHLDLYYQGQFDTSGKNMTSMEALIRWKHPVDGFISPAEFIPIAEEIGIIHKLTKWVFKTSFKQIHAWNTKYGMNYIMNVNISARSFHKSDFFSNLESYMNEYEIEPSWLGLELTEHSTMSGNATAGSFISMIMGLGIRLSIDDFGTGYSSISYLKQFTVNEIKIDKELIDDIGKEQQDLTILKAITLMAKGLGIETVAEGVETHEQYEMMKALDVNKIQGYYFAKPMNAAEFEEKFIKPSLKNPENQ